MGDYTSYVAGVSIALGSSFLSALGLSAQKRVHKQLDAEGIDPKKRRYFLHPIWLLGITCMLGGAIMSFAVFAFLGQARASAMASMTIVWNALLSAACLGERFTPVDGVTTAIIITGATVAVVFGSSGASAQSEQTIDTVVASLQRQIVWIGAIVLIAVYIAAYMFLRHTHKLRMEGKRTEFQKRLECFVRVCLGGLFSGSTGMLAKNVVVGISSGIRQGNIWFAGRFEFWLFVISLVPSLMLQLFYLNSALAQLDSLEVVPPYQCSIILVGLAWGFTFSAEGASATGSSLGLFAGGCAISCVGVGLLVFKRRIMRALGRPMLEPIKMEAAAANDAIVDVVADVKHEQEPTEVPTQVTILSSSPDNATVVAPLARASSKGALDLRPATGLHEVTGIDDGSDSRPTSIRIPVDAPSSMPAGSGLNIRKQSSAAAAHILAGARHSTAGQAIMEFARTRGNTLDHHAEHMDLEYVGDSFHLLSSLLHVVGNEVFTPVAKLSVEPFGARHSHVYDEDELRTLLARYGASRPVSAAMPPGEAIHVELAAAGASAMPASRPPAPPPATARAAPPAPPRPHVIPDATADARMHSSAPPSDTAAGWVDNVVRPARSSKHGDMPALMPPSAVESTRVVANPLQGVLAPKSAEAKSSGSTSSPLRHLHPHASASPVSASVAASDSKRLSALALDPAATPAMPPAACPVAGPAIPAVEGIQSDRAARVGNMTTATGSALARVASRYSSESTSAKQ